MTRRALLAAALPLLAACGVDGPPVPPPPKPAEEPERRGGITVSGSVGVGVAGGSGRVRTASGG